MKTEYIFEDDAVTITTGDVVTCIEALDCQEDVMTVGYHGLVVMVGMLHDKIIEQRETLDKLPKCWRLVEGKLIRDVLMLPGGEVFCEVTGCIVRASLFAVTGDGAYVVVSPGQSVFVQSEHCFDTREAAEYDQQKGANRE